MAFYEYSATNQALKINYSKLVDTCMSEFPFLASLKKTAIEGNGRTLNHTVKYARGGFAGAGSMTQQKKEYEQDAGSVEFSLPWKKYFGYKSIDSLQLELMEKSENKYIDGTASAQKDCTDDLLARVSASLLSRYPVTGPLFRLAASGAVSSSTITPLDKADLGKIEVGMYLTFDSVAVGSASAVTTYVTAIDRNAGTFDVNSATGIANSDYVMGYGDISATLSATVSGNFMPGIFAWCPIPTAVATRAVMTGDAYVFGNTRTVDMDRLCGWYYYGAGETSREEVLIKALARGDRINKARPSTICMNPVDMAALIIESAGRLVIQDNLVAARNESGRIANVGFSGVRIVTPSGAASAFTDSDMPLGVCVAYDPENVRLRPVNKEFPFIDDRGGSMWHPVELRTSGGTLSTTADLDRFQMIAKGYGTLTIEDPSKVGVIVLPPVTSY
jgi:hypothetical protein